MLDWFASPLHAPEVTLLPMMPASPPPAIVTPAPAPSESPTAVAPAFAITRPAGSGPLQGLTLDIDSGPLAVLQNDQRYGAAGTAYTAGTVALNRNLVEARRVSVESRWWDRHTVILLYAPLDITTRVTLGAPLTFRDTTFPAGAVIDHRYLFDGWRATYLYRGFTAGPLTFEGGATLGVRNAQVAMSQVNGDRYAAEYDIGPVPALRVRARVDMGAGAYGLLDVDGGTTPGFTSVRGGILDAALTLALPLLPGLDGTMRLRYLSGGADVPSRELVNWGQFAGATLGLRWSPVWGDQSAATP